MKPSSPAALLALVLASLALCQEPSAKDLRTLLHADVKQYAHDGRLVAAWSLCKPDELHAFDTPNAGTVKIVPAEGCVLTPEGEDEPIVVFKELLFRQAWKVTVDVKVDDGGAFYATLLDEGLPENRLQLGVNAPISETGSERYDFAGRIKNESSVGKPSYAASKIALRAWTPVVLELKNDRISLSVGKLERCALADVKFQRFALAFAATNGKVTLRNLTVDSQVDRDSIRKLFRSVTASTDSRATGADSNLEETAWQKLQEEEQEGSMDEAALAELSSLPPGVSDEVEAAGKLLGESPQANAQARLKIDRAINLAPKVGVLLWLRGVLAQHEGETARATACFEKAVEANPKLQGAWISLADERSQAGRHDEALAALTKAEALDPADPWVHVARARVHLDRGRLDDGRKEIQVALAKKPDSAGLKLFTKCLEKLSSKPEWKTTYKKENALYVVETSISSKLAADIADRLVVYRRFLDKAFPLSVRQTAPSRVWIFDSEGEYHLFAGSLTDGHEQTAGLYHPLIKTLLLTSKVNADVTQHVVFHEAFHQYLDLAVPDPPAWLNEGLAEYFGATTFDVSNRPTEGKVVTIRLPSLKGKELIPLRTLALMSHEAFMNPKGVGLHYAQSWAFVHFCKQSGSPAAAKAFDFYCTAVIAGKPHTDAFDLAFAHGADLAGIEAAFKDYVKTKLLGGR